jgi:choline dehydrogenase
VAAQVEVFDYIVVGSGSSGGVIAARLSESGRYQVLCLEAGTEDEKYIWSRAPLGGAFMIHNEKVNWNDFSEPSPSLDNRRIHVPHGKILGGSSAINATIANRGQRGDYDHWAQLGCRGWSYSDVAPFFRRLESAEIGSDEDRGRDGPVRISVAAKTSGLFDLFITAAGALGFKYNPDYMSGVQSGVTMAQLSSRRGKRNSVATQYVAPARGRKNLTILSGAHATKLILDGKKCVGVQYRHKGAIKEARAGEVIVSCGSINSPKLLELSGIGDPAILSSAGIQTVHELSGVGQNLQDHFGPLIQWAFNREGLSLYDQGRGWKLAREVLRYVLLGKGFIAQGIGIGKIYARSNPGVEDSDMLLIANPFLIEVGGQTQISGVGGNRSMSRINGFYIMLQLLRPESTGSVHVKSADPEVPPSIRYQFLETENDHRVLIEAFRLARRVVATSPLGDAIEREIAPGAEVQSDEDILSYARRTAVTSFHPAGTCKMGTGARAVVDERLKVHGIAGLRIADASIMPKIISGATNVPCIMIGEKAADMILTDARH